MSKPTKWAVAEGWHELGRSDLVEDIGEPACFACAAWVEGWDVGDTPASRWNRAKLDVCAVGDGSFILLCQGCHLSAPVCSDPEALWQWVSNRAAHGVQLARELTEELRALSIEVDDKLSEDIDRWRASGELDHQLAAMGCSSTDPRPSILAWAIFRARLTR